MRKRKKLISIAAIILAIIFIITFIASAFPVHAATAAEKLRAAKEEQAAIKSKLKNAEDEKTRIDNEITQLNSDISKIEKELGKTEAELSEKEAELSLAEAACEEQFSSFKTRARVMYENGPSTYIEILFASGSFSEFLSNVEIIRNLLDYDERVLSERKAAREVIAAQKAEIESIKAGQEAKREELTDSKAALTVKKNTQTLLIAELEKQSKQKAVSITDLQNQVASLNRQVRAASSSGSSSYTAPAVTFSGTASGEEAVRIAKNYIGVRYIYGGTTPNGFDCSGFVQYVYRKMGISINRVAADQAKNGVYVAREDLMPGDLVFFKKAGREIHHVGMYVGNGQYIHAPYTGRTICIEPLTRGDYYTARRIVA